MRHAIRTRHPLGGLLFISACRLAAGGTPCTDDETIESCYLKNQPTVSDTATKEESTAASSALAAKTTPADSFGSRLASTMKDFNPLFKAFIQSSQAADDGRALTIDVNLKQLGGGLASGWQLQGVVRKPEVYEALQLALPDATRSADVDALGKELGDLDDVTAVLSWGPQYSRLGRTFSGNSDLFSKLILELENEENNAQKQSAQSNVDDLLLSLAELSKGKLPADGQKARFEDLEEDTEKPILRAKAKKLVEDYSVGQAIVDSRFRERARKQNLIAMADLINNQPQLYVSGSYRSRAEIAGPDEVSLKVTYEHGFTNLNGLRRWCQCSDDPARTLSELPEYTQQHGHESALKHGDRFSFSAEYTEVKLYHVTLPSYGVDLKLDSSRTLIASMAYGRYVSFDANGKEVGRFDANARYEDYGSDPTRQRRAVASIAYTQKINKDWSVPIGLTWANRDEFVGEAQKKLSAHLGLSYKLPWKQ